MENISVDCVVVTYNKIKLLKECLGALLAQDFQLKNIIIIDNNSTDDTYTFVKELKKSSNSGIKLKLVHLNKNLGGAGGFNVGIRTFIEQSDSEYVWVMDDDTVPLKNSLSELVKVIRTKRKFGFLASNDRWIDGKAAVMNVPRPTKCWNEDVNNHLIRIKSASFVSLLLPRKVIKIIGLPISDFFIWGDDVEYTTRIFRNGFNNFLVPTSCVIHKIKNNIGTNIIEEKDKERIKRYYFANRNALYCKRKYEGRKGYLLELVRQIYVLVKIIFKSHNNTFTKFKASFRGTCSGVFFNPKVEMFKRYH
ncbi:glycosyltransferase family 2 protein [Lentilactobacillus parafarraginis]|uniref:Glycosyltransferase n=1 Tax=Lentilactobacillus parafarraginis DSM 18390 = JCM 14109 TaxID=1423786 RepID=A0A0R1YFU8_9LACO|nr:glycosyltransferase family 2 protein [Lentilactobacillus parafarraginis]KRM41186.1 glycosyltransferase [Lentilactobacillus parafarraginis DSM 18390 = JCM 14109]